MKSNCSADDTITSTGCSLKHVFILYNSKTVELETLRDLNERLAEELKGLHAAHRTEVKEKTLDLGASITN